MTMIARGAAAFQRPIPRNRSVQFATQSIPPSPGRELVEKFNAVMASLATTDNPRLRSIDNEYSEEIQAIVVENFLPYIAKMESPATRVEFSKRFEDKSAPLYDKANEKLLLKLMQQGFLPFAPESVIQDAAKLITKEQNMEGLDD